MAAWNWRKKWYTQLKNVAVSYTHLDVYKRQIVGRYGAPGQCVYSATKGAVISFSRSAAKELGPYNIRVNAIAPGITQTDMVVGLKKEFLDRRIAQIPLGRIATPQDIAEACVFLASDNSSYISGQVLGIDGGCTL